MTGAVDFTPFAYPDLRDRRVMLCVDPVRRGAMTSLWALVERLLTIVGTAREPILAQIKLAWWRDMLVRLAQDAEALPHGEPLLANLRENWWGSSDLAPLATQVEALLLATNDKEAESAAGALGQQVWRLTCSDGPRSAAGVRWGLVAAAAIQPGTPRAAALLTQATLLPPVSGGDKGAGRALFMLDRWALRIARSNGKRSLRSEATLLLRIGLFGH